MRRILDGAEIHSWSNFCRTALVNDGGKRAGAPRNVEDKELEGPPEECQGQQPPFLLRWSPSRLRDCAPDVFEWTPTSNRLALRPHHRACPPWVVPPTSRTTDAKKNSWLYCDTCHGHLTEGAHAVPFRDQRSALTMREDPKATDAGAEERTPVPEQYKRKCENALRLHRRGNVEPFSPTDLVPAPRP